MRKVAPHQSLQSWNKHHGLHSVLGTSYIFCLLFSLQSKTYFASFGMFSLALKQIYYLIVCEEICEEVYAWFFAMGSSHIIFMLFPSLDNRSYNRSWVVYLCLKLSSCPCSSAPFYLPKYSKCHYDRSALNILLQIQLWKRNGHIQHTSPYKCSY